MVSADKKEEVIAALKEAGKDVYAVGTLKSRRAEGCVLQNLDVWDY